jgi:hypothetical protein
LSKEYPQLQARDRFSSKEYPQLQARGRFTSKEYPQRQARGRFTLILGYELCIVEDLTVTVKCRTAIKALYLYSNVCLI